MRSGDARPSDACAGHASANDDAGAHHGACHARAHNCRGHACAHHGARHACAHDRCSHARAHRGAGHACAHNCCAHACAHACTHHRGRHRARQLCAAAIRRSDWCAALALLS